MTNSQISRTQAGMDPWGNNYQGGPVQGMTTDEITQAFSMGQQQQDEGYWDEGFYPAFEMPEFEMPRYETPDYAALQAQHAADAEKAAGLSEINSLFSSKFDAAEKATSDVNQQIADELGHAQLVGLDYTVDDVTKQMRINDLFANYWSESDESRLAGLTGKYGSEGYTWDLPIKRGNVEKAATKEKTEGAKAGEKVPAKGPKLTEEEDPLGKLG